MILQYRQWNFQLWCDFSLETDSLTCGGLIVWQSTAIASRIWLLARFSF